MLYNSKYSNNIIDKIRSSLVKLEKYILEEKYLGYDPFDILNSPLFGLPLFKNNRFMRFGSQQVFKKLPINLRPVFLVRKGLNPVTLGLVLQSFTYLSLIIPEKKEFYLKEISFCISELKRMISRNYTGVSWGYDFDWEARYTRINAFVPTIVATGIITNALFQYYQFYKDEQAFQLCNDSALFITTELSKTYFNNYFCYSYSPLDKQVVYNATMKGARLLAQVYFVTKENKLAEEAFNTVAFVCNEQKSNGSWSYSKGDKRNWADNFHTGYILDCLDEYIKLTDEKSFEKNLLLGVNYYKNIFFINDRIPKYFHDSIYPIDSTSIAQSIFTLIRFGFYDTAEGVTNWALQNMQDEEGFFYYQKHRFFTNKISYMRWSNSWMLLALSFSLFKNSSK